MVLASLAAFAGASRAEGLEGIVRVMKIGELIVPDLRLELASGDKRLVFAVPVAYTVASPRIAGRFGATLVGFAEPQLRVTGDTSLRALAGGRLYLHAHAPLPDVWEAGSGFGLLVEAGGLVGQDGSGGFAGAGIAYGDLPFGVSIALVSRLALTTEENRVDFALDFQVPLNLE